MLQKNPLKFHMIAGKSERWKGLWKQQSYKTEIKGVFTPPLFGLYTGLVQPKTEGVKGPKNQGPRRQTATVVLAK